MSFNGAYALSTPIGIGLKTGERVVGFGFRNTDLSLAGLSGSSAGFDSAGSLQGVFGISTPIGDLTFSHFVISSKFDHVNHLQFSPKINSDKWNVSIGAHNYWGRGQSAGENIPGDERYSRSLFIAATCEYQIGNFFTIGKGDRRFQGLFANHTYSFGERFKHMIEWDRFGFNQMFYYSCSLPFLVNKGQPGKLFVGVGAVGGVAGVWTINFSF